MKKKISVLFCMILMLFLVSNNTAFASTMKNFYGYQVNNVNVREFGAAVKKAIEEYKGSDNFVKVDNVRNAYIYTDASSSYFVRIYPANNNTHIYVVANEKYDVTNNSVTDYIKKSGLEYSKLDDKDALKEYKNDFYVLARQKQLGNFYISPDLIKPLKTGMSKLNNKLAKNNKKTSVIAYSEDRDPIKLTCIDTTGCYDENAKVAIVKREYRLKQKENKYVHAFEYIITNNNTSTASVSATSERLAGIKDVATESFVDLDRLDLLDTVASFPPVLICTCGLSIVCSVPNWIRLARITKEASRYAHALPQNYQLRQNGRMRVLVLKYKHNPKPVNFNFKFANGEYDVAF